MSAPDLPRPELSASTDDPAITRALAHLERFRRIVLPGYLRRSRQWNGLDAHRHADVLDDLAQELALDCVAHATTIDALPAEERHRRWLGIAQRTDYDLRRRDRRRRVTDVESVEPATPAPTSIELTLDAGDAALFDRLLEHAQMLGNGRFSLLGTARAMHVSRTRIQRLWAEVACALGVDAHHVAFWTRRLAEALCMIAAARLRADGALHVWDDARRRAYDADAFRDRIERIRTELTRCPPDTDVRRSLDTIAPRSVPQLQQVPPRDILELAEELAPDDAAVLQWRFEAELLAGEFGVAARCLRRAQRVEPDRARCVLARARLLEARGRTRAARTLLARAIGRIGADARLVASLEALGGSVRRYAPSSAARSATRARSHSA